MNIFKFNFDGSTTKIQTLENIFLPKILSTNEEIVYVIGGSADLKVTSSFKSLFKIQRNSNSEEEYSMTELQNMNDERVSCGCCLSADQKWIYVAGGYQKS